MANYRINRDSNQFFITKSKSAADETDCFSEFSVAKNKALARIDHLIADLKEQRRTVRATQEKDLEMGAD